METMDEPVYWVLRLSIWSIDQSPVAFSCVLRPEQTDGGTMNKPGLIWDNFLMTTYSRA